VIPPKQNGNFVAAMERVLDVYKRPYDSRFPVICMDESPKQLIGETRKPLPTKPGRVQRFDYEYVRHGMCTTFIACEPLAGWRMVKVSERKKKQDWAAFIKDIAQAYETAERITLVMDNLNTHAAGSFYETFPPKEAKALWDRFEFVCTPKHGSWLNIAEIELNVINNQCLNRRLDDIEVVRQEVEAWSSHRNVRESKVDWQFTTEDARIKLKRLYPTIES